MGENCEESVENEIVTERVAKRDAVELRVVWRIGEEAARLVGPLGEHTHTHTRRDGADWPLPSRLNELAKTVANCQSTDTSQAQQSRVKTKKHISQNPRTRFGSRSAEQQQHQHQQLLACLFCLLRESRSSIALLVNNIILQEFNEIIKDTKPANWLRVKRKVRKKRSGSL